MRVPLGILLSGSGSTYANLAEHIADGRLAAQIAVVISSRPDAGGLDRAAAFGHRSVVCRSPEAVTAALREAGAEWVAMCGYLRYFDPPPPFAGRTLNIHPSLLPDFGGKGMYGLNVHRAVIEAGARESGCTVHQVTGAYDTGPILAQERVPVLADDTPESLQERVMAAERRLYPRVLQEQFTTQEMV